MNTLDVILKKHKFPSMFREIVQNVKYFNKDASGKESLIYFLVIIFMTAIKLWFT
jgi:hypothetical protein